MDPVTKKIIEFLGLIGFTVETRDISEETFLPGITVVDGALVVDVGRLKYPGDLLHEAGHLAVLSATEREGWSGDFTGAGGYEMGAIAWSYAACVHLGLPVQVLFHEHGYRGDPEWLTEVFANGPGVGVPILEWKGMATSSGDRAYPHMLTWLCPQER